MIRLKPKHKPRKKRNERKHDAFIISIRGISGGYGKTMHLLAKPPLGVKELADRLTTAMHRGKV